MKSEWLKEDIAGVKTYLNEHMEIDRPLGDIEKLQQAIILWQKAKWQGDQQKTKDKKHWEKVKDGHARSCNLWWAFICNGKPVICYWKALAISQ